ncbi:DUF4168 domain-containing protein [Litoribacter ruber]|uniref:DUF4168 domain-containing protein n=2 Tax=Litoribacter ruber TaxID=702568 RepID=A0AAP2G0F2_9BACT|nr:DUF4168 domain-containing protein [Litoribacter alkaliphilus]MBT0811224.1 DUF4168 domain-containing protein [Litoribacter ruber]
MINSKLSKIFTLSFIFSFALILGVMAQQQMPPQQQQQVNDNFTDEEYEKFVKINKEIIPLQEEMQSKMMETIEETGLDVNRFNELAQAQQAGNIKEVSQDPDEIAKFNEAGQKVVEMNQEIGQAYQEKMAENDMDQQKFQEMMMAYQQSEKVRTKIDSMMDDEN